jgi:hypothetical protein
MLKRIDVADVRLGMYIHKLEGPWLKHPFWKSKFLLTDAGQLADLHASELEAVVIDVEKGDDVGGQPARRRQLVSSGSQSRMVPIERPRIELTPTSRSSGAGRPFDPRSTNPLSTAREVSNVIGIVARSERVLSACSIRRASARRSVPARSSLSLKSCLPPSSAIRTPSTA